MLHQYFCSPSELFCVFLCLFRLRLFRILKYLPCTCSHFPESQHVPSQPKYMFPFGNIPFCQHCIIRPHCHELSSKTWGSSDNQNQHTMSRQTSAALSAWNMEHKHLTSEGKTLYKTETAALPAKFFFPPLFCVFLFIPFKYTSSHKVNRLWVSLLLHFFHARSGKTLRSCHCFSRKTLADLVSLIPGTLRVLAELGRIYSGVFGINPMWLSNELGTIRGGSR